MTSESITGYESKRSVYIYICRIGAPPRKTNKICISQQNVKDRLSYIRIHIYNSSVYIHRSSSIVKVKRSVASLSLILAIFATRYSIYTVCPPPPHYSLMAIYRDRPSLNAISPSHSTGQCTHAVRHTHTERESTISESLLGYARLYSESSVWRGVFTPSDASASLFIHSLQRVYKARFELP